MARVSHEIGIGVRPGLVEAVTLDVAAWPDWHPLVRQVVPLDPGPIAPGARFRLKQPGQPETIWQVTELAPGRFTWEAGSSRYGRMVAGHVITAAGEGTRNRLWLDAQGARFSAPLLQLALAIENRALRRACEARA